SSPVSRPPLPSRLSPPAICRSGARCAWTRWWLCARNDRRQCDNAHPGGFMRVSVKGITFAGALSLLTAATAGADGVQIVMKVTSDGGAAQTSQVQIDGRRMRAEGFGDRGEKQNAVFDGT